MPKLITCKLQTCRRVSIAVAECLNLTLCCLYLLYPVVSYRRCRAQLKFVARFVASHKRQL